MIGQTFLGEKLRQARRQAGISQKRFAAEVGCHISTVVRCETGSNQWVSVEMVYRFVAAANRLGITIDGLDLGFDDIVRADPTACPACAARERAQAGLTEARSA